MPAPGVVQHRLFDVRSANVLVPRLLQIFTTVRERLERMRRAARELQELGVALPDDEPIEVDPSAPPDVQRRQHDLRRLGDEISARLAEVAELGAEVKAIDGLVDFRSRRAGRLVYLCWRYPEESITTWHDLTAGFAGRQTIDDPEAFEGDYLQ